MEADGGLWVGALTQGRVGIVGFIACSSFSFWYVDRAECWAKGLRLEHVAGVKGEVTHS